MQIGNAVGGAGLYGSENAPATKENITGTIQKLQRQLDEFRRGNGVSGSEKLNSRALNLEQRIDNLKKRLDKLEEKQDGECQTCKNRKYQDESDDPGVSFKSAQTIAKGAVAAAVRGHEQEHVVRERAKAEREGREVVSQSVVIKTAVCPECGDTYVAGGETTTVTRTIVDNSPKNDFAGKSDKSEVNPLEWKFSAGDYKQEIEKGQFLNVLV